MALISCTECGRTISDKAAACVGCGAPLQRPTSLDLVPRRSSRPALTRRQLTWRAVAFALVLALGVLWARTLQTPPAERWQGTLAALLVVIGLCGAIVTAVQFVSRRR